MQMLIQHRINTLAQLRALPHERGAEIDLRSDVARPSSLHLAHDPYTRGEAFEPWLDAWSQTPRGPLVLNTKEDGLEAVAIEMCRARRIDNFVFLDTQIPTLLRLAREGLGRHLSLRLSAVEPGAWLTPWLELQGPARPRMLWVDCFARRPLAVDLVEPWAKDFDICLVSPDLQGDLQADFAPFLPLASHAAMICSKRCDEWKHLLSART